MSLTIQFANRATSSLTSGIMAGGTSLTVAAGQGSKFPALAAGQYFYCTLQSATDATIVEIIKVTAISGDTFSTIVRAQEGTTALAWNTGDIVELRVTAQGMRDVSTQSSTPNNILFFTGQL